MNSFFEQPQSDLKLNAPHQPKNPVLVKVLSKLMSKSKIMGPAVDFEMS